MGKNYNQIATFADLYSIGYRVPSGKEVSTECVTYDDLKSMDNNYSSTGLMNNVFIDKSYYNGSQDLHLNTNESDLREFSGTFQTPTTRITTSGVKLIGTFNIPSGAGAVYFPSAIIYIKLIPYTGYNYSNFNFEIKLRIQDQFNNTKWSSGNWINIDEGYKKGEPVSFVIPSLTVLESNNTYSLCLDYQYSGNSGYSLGCYAAFERGSIYFQTYSGNKCVPWQYVKGSLGQLSENGVVENPAKILVDCTLTETISLSDPDISYLGFIYHYVQNGSEKTYTITSRSNFEVAASKKFTIHLPINLKADSNITDDWLEIALTANTGVASHYYKFSVIIDGVTQTKTSSKTNGRTTMTISGRYNDVVRGLESINIKIYN